MGVSYEAVIDYKTTTTKADIIADNSSGTTTVLPSVQLRGNGVRRSFTQVKRKKLNNCYLLNLN